MATFDLKKQLTIHDRGLLRQLLGNEPPMQTIDWDAMPRNNIAPLIAAWESMEDAKKRHYQVILQDVQHLAEPKGLKVLIEELEWRHRDKLPAFAAQLGTADKALWAFSSYPGARCTGVENTPVYAPDHLHELRQFTSVLTLTFRLWR